MESRRLMAASPVVGMTMTGTEQEVTGIVLKFATPLDPVTAQNPKAYFVRRDRKTGGGTIFDFFGIDTTQTVTRRVTLQSAVYDAAAQTVTLTPATPFDLVKRFRRVRVAGRGRLAVKDAAGLTIDGDGNGVAGGSLVLRNHVARVSRLTFREPDGDRARLRLVGPGKIWEVVSRRRVFPPILFLNKTNALKSGLLGHVVRNPRTGDGVVTIGQVTGTTFAAVPILGDPAFHFVTVNP